MNLEAHNQTVRVPRIVTVEPVRLNKSLTCGNREQFDAFADEMLRKEREAEAQTQFPPSSLHDRAKDSGTRRQVSNFGGINSSHE